MIARDLMISLWDMVASNISTYHTIYFGWKNQTVDTYLESASLAHQTYNNIIKKKNHLFQSM